MKKAVFFVAALVLIAAIGFAQGVKIGGWGRGFLEFAGSTVDGQDPVMGPAIGWWTGNGPRIGINIIGSSENVGFQIDMNVDNGSVSQGDQAKIWVKPIKEVTIQLGNSCYDDTLRGNASFGVYNWIRFAGTPGDGLIFKRVGDVVGGNGLEGGFTGDSTGANFILGLDPVEGLHIFAAFTPGNGSNHLVEDTLVTDAMYGAGYAITGIGLLRAQYLAVNQDLGFINAAFKVTAVPGLGLDIGARIPTDAAYNAGGLMAKTSINLTAGYAVMPTLTLNALVDIEIVSEDASGVTDGYIEWYGGVEGEYALPMDLVATVDVRVKGDTQEDSDMGWGVLAAIQKNFSNGLVGLGVEVTNIGFAGPAPAVTADTIGWAIPLRLEYWF